MKQIRFLQAIALLGALFSFVSIGCRLSLPFTEYSESSFIASNTYLGPTSPVVGNPQLIRVEVDFYDSPKSGGLEIVSGSFNGVSIPLKPRDVYGFRGKGSFQLPSGNYPLKWVVNRDNYAWPRTATREEAVSLDPRDLWVQIRVVGEEASIR